MSAFVVINRLSAYVVKNMSRLRVLNVMVTS